MKKKTLPQILKTILPAGGAALLAVALTGCGSGDDPTASDSSPAEPAAPELEAVFLETEPQEAVTVLQARKDAKPGDAITVTGRIAGTSNPFTEGYAVFVLGDDSLETCDRVPGDECPTPWDACCVDGKTLKASRLSIQVLGDDGRPVAKNLKGVRGLKELDAVVISGTVAEGSTADNMIVNAEGVFQKVE